MADEPSPMRSGQQIAKANLVKFQSWIVEREQVNDWHDYLRGEKLNRSESAAECGFALSVLRQNPAVRNALEVLEERFPDHQSVARGGASGLGLITNP